MDWGVTLRAEVAADEGVALLAAVADTDLERAVEPQTVSEEFEHATTVVSLHTEQLRQPVVPSCGLYVPLKQAVQTREVAAAGTSP